MNLTQMKSLLLTTVFMLSFLLSYSQVDDKNTIIINDKNLNLDSSIQYIKLSFFLGLTGNSLRLIVDYGVDYEKIPSGTDIKFKDGNGIERRFTTVIEALNYFYNRGWEYKDTWLFPVGTAQHFILTRRHK